MTPVTKKKTESLDTKISLYLVHVVETIDKINEYVSRFKIILESLKPG